jgi:hypothetical protein
VVPLIVADIESLLVRRYLRSTIAHFAPRAHLLQAGRKIVYFWLIARRSGDDDAMPDLPFAKLVDNMHHER